MMQDLPQNETRTRLLDITVEQFATRGHTAVHLRDIACAIGMGHASLNLYEPLRFTNTTIVGNVCYNQNLMFPGCGASR